MGKFYGPRSWDFMRFWQRARIGHMEIGISQPSPLKWRSRQLAEVPLVSYGWKGGIWSLSLSGGSDFPALAGSWRLAVLPLKPSVMGLNWVLWQLWPSVVLPLNRAFAEPIDQLGWGCVVAVTRHYWTCPPRSPRQSHERLARFAELSNGQPGPHSHRGADR